MKIFILAMLVAQAQGKDSQDSAEATAYVSTTVVESVQAEWDYANPDGGTFVVVE
jgi:predicted alpha-1,6-mannanase (GH76 family)